MRLILSFKLPLVNNYFEIFSPAALGACADSYQAVHLGPEIDVRPRLGPDHRVAHRAGFGVDDHGLKDVERAGDIFLEDPTRVQGLSEIFPASVLGRGAPFSAKPLPCTAVYFKDLVAPFFVEGNAAHALFHIMGPLVGILYDRHHHVVELGDQNVAGADVDLSQVDLGPRLVEPLPDIFQVEDDEVRGGLAGHANDLILFYRERLPGVAWNNIFLNDAHSCLLMSVWLSYVNRWVRSRAGEVLGLQTVVSVGAEDPNEPIRDLDPASSGRSVGL